jgi:hypothetical protein
MREKLADRAQSMLEPVSDPDGWASIESRWLMRFREPSDYNDVTHVLSADS